MKKSLPISISSFDQLIENNYLYIDKTKYAYNLFKQGAYKYVFLARPRRFGKSLFVETLKQIFLGKKDLFKDLWIYKSDYDWQVYPVIHIDFSKFNKHNADTLEKNILEFIEKTAEAYNIKTLDKYSGINMKFSQLLEELSKINKVVVLIDEYDKPILDNILNIENAEKIRDLMRSFYEVIKASDNSIRAVFMTGVTKFSQMSIFSRLNNLKDISLDDRYAEILGYTEGELTGLI